MTLLSASFREQVKKTKDFSMINEQSHSVAYPTGFLSLDFLNGGILKIADRKYYQVGIIDGTINALIARSGAGKTTFAVQIASNIVRPYKTSCVFMDNAEAGYTRERIKQMSKFNKDEFRQRFIVRDSGITTESIYHRVKLIHDLKVDHKDEYLYDTGIIDEYNNKIYKFEPTVYILDSLKTILPKKLTEDEGSNMNGSTTARVNSDIFTRLLTLCKEANIIILVINHITTGGIGSVTPVKAGLAYLKQGESLPGGKTASTYLQNCIFRLDEKVKLKETDTPYYIDGAMVSVEITKSRTNKVGKSISLVFDQNNGYDADLSLYEYLKSRNVVTGAGAYWSIPGYDGKFPQSKVKELLSSDPAFIEAFSTAAMNELIKDLEEREAKKVYEENLVNSYSSPYEAILSKLSGNMA